MFIEYIYKQILGKGRIVKMVKFIDDDIKEINNSYRNMLINLKDYLYQYNLSNEKECSKIIIKMLHSGYFSINRVIQIENNYDYLALPPTISQGVQIMYGICCCRHASKFLYDLLCILDFNPILIYYFVDNNGGWHKANPAVEKANHIAVLLNNNDGEYVVDLVNEFILKIERDGQLKSIDIESIEDITPYQDSNVDVIGKVLTKYYKYKELGIESVYEY